MGEIMLSELQQKDVWEGWLSAEMRSNYFAARGSYYSNLQSGLTWGTLLASSGAAATFLAGSGPQWIKPALALVAAGLSLLSVVMQNQKRYSDCSDLHVKWNRLSTEYKSVWEDMYSEEAPQKLSKLEERAAELSRSGIGIPYHEKTMTKWENHVLRHHGLAAA